MPTIAINLTTPIARTFRAAQVAGMFDLPLDELPDRFAHTLTAEVPGLDEDWTIGAIVGPSGSGKTTLARAAYGEIYQPPPWPEDVPVIECLEGSGFRVQGSVAECQSSCLNPEPRTLNPLKHLLRLLTAVGLASPPSWLLPYRVLSTGERFRADLARALFSQNTILTQRLRGAEEHSIADLCAPAPLREDSGLLVIDEFTSALDRTTACTASASLARLLRSPPFNPQSEIRNLKFIALSCHADFLPWLAPDWVLDLTAGQEGERGRVGERENHDLAPAASLPLAPSPTLPLFRPSWPRGSLQRPQLRLAVRRVPQAIWPRFARHHYLSGGLARSATCYAAYVNKALTIGQGDGLDSAKPGAPEAAGVIGHSTPTNGRGFDAVAFCATLAALGWKKTKRISRLVVLPEFQGLGIGARLAEAVAAHEAAKGNRVTITASHPAIVAWCWHSPRWKYTGLKKTGSTRQRLAGREIRSSLGRAVASFEWVARKEGERGRGGEGETSQATTANHLPLSRSPTLPLLLNPEP